MITSRVCTALMAAALSASLNAGTVETPLFTNGFETVVVSGEITPEKASRFLSQSTFGPAKLDIESLVALGDLNAWIDQQIAAPPSWQEPAMRTINAAMCGAEGSGDHLARHQAWWDAVLNGPDQLRLRTAFALSQMMVVSDHHQTLKISYQFALAAYYDVLMRHAFGNYRDLLGEVTTHPTMGIFLSMVKNERADPARNVHPDENFAREVLQLFSMGVHELNVDGSLVLQNQAPVDTYDQNLIQSFARVFTGWNFAGLTYWWEYGGLTSAMEPWDESHPGDSVQYHDTDSKTLLNGATIDAGLSTQDDLDAALDNIFAHPNVGPFVSKRLIQHFVTSNPSAAYIGRVAAVFNDNGQGERGNLEAVVRAILLDAEARSDRENTDSFGKLREPLLRFTHAWRAIGVTPVPKDGAGLCDTGGTYSVYQVPWWLGSFDRVVGQQVLSAPSVFNFFSPNFSPQGVMRDQGITGPEFQLLTDSLTLSTANAANTLMHEPNVEQLSFELDDETTLAAEPALLVDHLDLVFMQGSMSSELRAALLNHLNNDAAFPPGQDTDRAKAEDAITLVLSSPEYLVRN